MLDQESRERRGGAFRFEPSGAVPERVRPRPCELERFHEPCADFADAIELDLGCVLVSAHDEQRSGDP